MLCRFTKILQVDKLYNTFLPDWLVNNELLDPCGALANTEWVLFDGDQFAGDVSVEVEREHRDCHDWGFEFHVYCYSV